MVSAEMKRNKLKLRALQRAWDLEEKLISGKESDLEKVCVEKMDRREGVEIVYWREEAHGSEKVKGWVGGRNATNDGGKVNGREHGIKQKRRRKGSSGG